MRKHPSGRPIARVSVKRGGWARIPERGALTPRLREENVQTQAIGFTVPGGLVSDVNDSHREENKREKS